MDIRTTPDGVTIKVRVAAGARRDAIVGVHGDALKVSVRQAPEKGKANREVARLLAAALGVRPADVEVVRGAAAKDKLLLVRGADEREVRAKLMP